jgi:hypothetical protein
MGRQRSLEPSERTELACQDGAGCTLVYLTPSIAIGKDHDRQARHEVHNE